MCAVSTFAHSSRVPPVWTRSSTMTTWRPEASPTMHGGHWMYVAIDTYIHCCQDKIFLFFIFSYPLWWWPPSCLPPLSWCRWWWATGTGHCGISSTHPRLERQLWHQNLGVCSVHELGEEWLIAVCMLEKAHCHCRQCHWERERERERERD